MVWKVMGLGLGLPFPPLLSHQPCPWNKCKWKWKWLTSSSVFPNHAAPITVSPRFFTSSTTNTTYPNMSSAVRSQSDPDVASTSATASVVQKKFNFCPSCGGPTKQIIPDGDEKLRDVCSLCGKVLYENPKMVVGCLVEHENKVLLCKRKIHPSYGLWTLPAGYLEVGESAVEGAARETLEEACAEVDVLSPFAQLDIPRIGQYRVT